MNLDRVVIAIDQSEAGRQAVRAARELARRASSRLFIVWVVSRRPTAPDVGTPGVLSEADLYRSEHERLRRWVDADLPPGDVSGKAELAVAAGVPSIEISRYAEAHRGDLLVLGRKVRTHTARLLVGDTADAVGRRSRVPCLFVPSGAGSMRRVLVALDGSERGMVVLQQACGFARAVGASLRVVMVEPAASAAALEPPPTRGDHLAGRAEEIVARELGDQRKVEAAIRRGAIVEQVLWEVEESRSDVLALGFNRGGPPGVLEAGSTARRLAHLAPCAVLTIPL